MSNGTVEYMPCYGERVKFKLYGDGGCAVKTIYVDCSCYASRMLTAFFKLDTDNPFVYEGYNRYCKNDDENDRMLFSLLCKNDSYMNLCKNQRNWGRFRTWLRRLENGTLTRIGLIEEMSMNEVLFSDGK